MKTIVTFIILISAIALSSCSNGKTEAARAAVDSSLYITKDIKLYDSIDTLLKKGFISPSVTGASKYVGNDKNYKGTPFEEVDINYAEKDKTEVSSDSLTNICYGTYCLRDSIQDFYGKIYQKISLTYGKPNKELLPDIESDKITSAIWYKQKYIIILRSTLPQDSNGGSVILIFTAPQDTAQFKWFFF